MSNLRVEALKVGRNYRVIYHVPSHRLPRQMVASYLEANEETTFWNLRPIAGTTALNNEWIQQIWETDMQKSPPTIYRGETRIF